MVIPCVKKFFLCLCGTSYSTSMATSVIIIPLSDKWDIIADSMPYPMGSIVKLSRAFEFRARNPDCESVTGQDDAIFVNRSRVFWPTDRYNGILLSLSRNREPITRSAFPSRIGAITLGISSGWCCPSPSSMTTISAFSWRARSNPLITA